MALLLGDVQTLESRNNGETWKQYFKGSNDIIEYDDLKIASTKDAIYLNKDGEWKKTNLNAKEIESFVVCKKDIYVKTKDGMLISSYPFEKWEAANHSGYFDGELGLQKIDDIERPVVVGKDGALSLNKKEITILSTKPSILLNKKIFLDTSIDIKNLKKEDVDSTVVYILNEILYPYVSLKYTGYLMFPLGEIMIKSKDGDLDKVVYVKTTEEYYKQPDTKSFIDWQKDVGMSPLDGVTIGDIINSQAEETVFLYNQAEPIETYGYTKTKQKTLEILEKVKSRIITDAINKIETTEIGGISEVMVDTEAESLESDIEAYNFNIENIKKTNESFIAMMTTRIYDFDDFFLRKLVKNSIYEIVNSLAGVVKYKLIQAVEKKQETFDVFKLDLKTSYNKGVLMALEKYSEEVNKKTISINDENDRDLINISVRYYKNVSREKLLELSSSTIKEEIKKINFSKMPNIYSEAEADMNSFFDIIKDLDNKEDIINTFKNYDFSFRKINYYNFTGRLFNELYNKYSRKIKEKIEQLQIDEKYYEENILNLQENEKKNVYKYIKEIHEKFASRTLELLLKCFNETNISIDVEKNQFFKLEQWVYEYSNNIGQKKYFNNYYLPSFKKQLENDIENILNKILEKFEKEREII